MPEAQLVDYPPSTVVTTQVTCRHEDLGPVIGEAFGKIGACAEGLQQTDSPRVYYLEWLPDTCTIEAAIPVEGTVQAQGEVQVKSVPGGTALMASYFGPYSGLASAWDALWKEVADKGFKATGMCWDDYVTDPADEPDESKWQTDIYVAVDIPKL